jgi:hypothetical protein
MDAILHPQADKNLLEPDGRGARQNRMAARDLRLSGYGSAPVVKTGAVRMLIACPDPVDGS